MRPLEKWVRPGDSVLDIGTGSGVLSIVAAKLGAHPVWATDIDPLAIRVAGENADLNGLSLGFDQLHIRQGSVPDGQEGRFSLIVSNILAEVLIGLFDAAYGNVPLAAPLAPGGRMILSGILEEKAGTVVAAAVRHGLAEVERLQEGDWVAITVQSEREA